MHVFREVFQLDLRPRRDRERHQDTCNRRMNARFQEQHPHAEAQRIVEQLVVDFHLPAQVQDSQQQHRQQQGLERDMPAVEKRNDDNAPDIVDHGQRRQENAHAQGHPFSQQP